MKKISILITTIIIVLSFKGFKDNTIDVYIDAIYQHISGFETGTIYILKCSDLELPSKIGSQNIVFIDNVNKFMKGRKKTNIIRLMPLHLEGGNVNVILIDYLLEKKANGTINLSNNGGEIFTYTYDVNNDSYKLVSRKKNSI